MEYVRGLIGPTLLHSEVRPSGSSFPARKGLRKHACSRATSLGQPRAKLRCPSGWQYAEPVDLATAPESYCQRVAAAKRGCSTSANRCGSLDSTGTGSPAEGRPRKASRLWRKAYDSPVPKPDQRSRAGATAGRDTQNSN